MVSTLKTRVQRRAQSMKTERKTWEPTWHEIQSFTQPYAGRFFVDQKNKGTRKLNNIIDNTAMQARRILSSGLMSGLTSPARPWFRLSLPDQELADFGPVKEWLDMVTRKMLMVFNASNLYQTLPTIYSETGTFGIGAIMVLDDPRTIARFRAFTLGEYWVANGKDGKVDAFYYQGNETAYTLKEKYGEHAISNRAKSLLTNDNPQQQITVNYLVEKNTGRDASKSNNRNMAYRSLHWEEGGDKGDDHFLRQSGYNGFPMFVPRWDLVPGDTYGYGCGHLSLGDVKQLQHQQRFKAVGLEKMVNPPLVSTSGMKSDIVNVAPAGISHPTQTGAPNANLLTTLHEINRFPIAELRDDMASVSGRIDQAFYADLFLMLSSSDRRQITATEVAERHEEKLLMLGPVLQRLNDELLKPLIDRTFDKLVEHEQIPVPPSELSGVDLDIQFISLLAQAQQLVGIGAIERVTGFAANLAAIQPEVIDKINFDQAIDEYAGMAGVPASIIRSDDDVSQLREDRREQEAQQAALAQAPAASQAATAAKTLGETNLSGLTELINGGVS